MHIRSKRGRIVKVIKNNKCLYVFWESKGAFSGGKQSGTGPKKKPLKRNSFGAAGEIMLPSESGKHIFKNLVSRRMKIQQNLKTVWKNLENIMTIDEEMKELSAKAAKASRKQEKCENNKWFAIVFLNQALPRWRVKIGKTVPRCLQWCTRTSRTCNF